MNTKNILIFGGALYLALYVYRKKAKAAEPDSQISAFQASRM